MSDRLHELDDMVSAAFQTMLDGLRARHPDIRIEAFPHDFRSEGPLRDAVSARIDAMANGKKYSGFLTITGLEDARNDGSVAMKNLIKMKVQMVEILLSDEIEKAFPSAVPA